MAITSGVRRLIPQRVRTLFHRKTLGPDLRAGAILGVECVPDSLANGLLAGVNPVAGLYAYLYGMVGAALFTSSSFMAVQTTGAMALIVSDADVSSRDDPDRALFTLALLTGLVMVLAGLLRAGRLLRFVPTAVMTGFITAVGINIVLGQLGNFTGYDAPGSNRVVRAVSLLLHPSGVELPALLVGVVTLVGIILLTRTRLSSLGLVVAVVLGSCLAALLQRVRNDEVVLVDDLADLPRALPSLVMPAVGDAAFLLLPALSLAFVGLVQGAAVSASAKNPDGRPADASRDFIGQGAGNIAAGLFQGMPVGGSMSGTSLVVTAGARTRLSLIFAGGVMALVILALADVVGLVAMPALAALLIVVGARAIKPAAIHSVVKTGPFQTATMFVTLGLTLAIPLQYAVLVGVGFAIVLHVAEQSNKLTVRQLVFQPDGRVREATPPAEVPPGDVLVLQPYGSLFFASAPVFEAQLPTVTATSECSVVVIRLRGIDQLGLSVISVLCRYAGQLHQVHSTMKVIITSDRIGHQLRDEGLLDLIGEGNVYRGTEWLGETVRKAYGDSCREIETRTEGGSTD